MLHSDLEHRRFLEQAIFLSRLARPTMTAFSVGAVIVDSRTQEVLTTGYSREIGPEYHAEEVAILKATNQNLSLEDGVIYSSLEPCCKRLSGKQSCAVTIVAAKIKTVVFALPEPNIFVPGNGAEFLRNHKVQVIVINHYDTLVQQINAHLY